MRRLLVIGGDAAGMSAASHVRRAQPDTEIVVIERSPHTSYSMCGIPAYIGTEIEDADDLIIRTPAQFREQGITVHDRTEATEVDPSARTVQVTDLRTGEQRAEPYDALLVATGAHPVTPDLPGIAEYVHVLRTLDEAQELRHHLDTHETGHAVVVGGGYIGMEIAEALIRRGIDSTLVDVGDQVLAETLDADMAAHVHDRLEQFGVTLALGRAVTAVDGAGDHVTAVHTDAETIPATLCVLAAGSRPNVAIAAGAGCVVGESGALVVDAQMRTSMDGIWAAGDVVESTELVGGQPRNVQLGTHANKQGKVAGIDIVAAAEGERGAAAFPGVVGTAVTKVCDWEIGRTGLTETAAAQAGLDFAAVTFTGTARAGYMPDAGTVHVKMLAERGTGRVLGCQLVGTGNVAKRIDVAAVWCQLGVTVQEAQLMDLSYAPPFGGVWDLLQVAARKLVRELGLSPQL